LLNNKFTNIANKTIKKKKEKYLKTSFVSLLFKKKKIFNNNY